MTNCLKCKFFKKRQMLKKKTSFQKMANLLKKW